MHVVINVKDDTGKVMSTRSGIGAKEIINYSVNKYTGELESTMDMDFTMKSALSEAVKKAGFYYGIGAYLWDEDERAIITGGNTAGDHISEVGRLSDTHLQTIVDTRTKLGFAKTEMPELVREFAKEVLGKTVDGNNPDCLCGATEAESKENVLKLVTFLNKKAGK